MFALYIEGKKGKEETSAQGSFLALAKEKGFIFMQLFPYSPTPHHSQNPVDIVFYSMTNGTKREEHRFLRFATTSLRNESSSCFSLLFMIFFNSHFINFLFSHPKMPVS